MSTMTFAIRNVGKWIYRNNNKPKNSAGPKWNGVKGMILILLNLSYHLFSYTSEVPRDSKYILDAGKKIILHWAGNAHDRP